MIIKTKSRYRLSNLRYPIAGLLLTAGAAAVLNGCGSDSNGSLAPSSPATTQPALATWQLPTGEMPLGPTGLQEARTNSMVSPGVTYYQITRGQTASTDFWTVTVEFANTQAAAAPAASAMAAIGFQVRYDSAGNDPTGAPLGYNVSIGQYPTQAAAQAVATQIATQTNNAYKPSVRNTGLDGSATSTGPWLVNILAISPTFSGNLQNVIAGGNESGIGGLLGVGGETPQSTANRLGAIAAINSGF